MPLDLCCKGSRERQAPGDARAAVSPDNPKRVLTVRKKGSVETFGQPMVSTLKSGC